MTETETLQNRYTYFVRYTVRTPEGVFNGMCEYLLFDPISDFGQLEKIAKNIKSTQRFATHEDTSVVIDNYILLNAELTVVREVGPKVEVVGTWRGLEKHREEVEDVETAEERVEDLSETNREWSFEILVDGEPLGAGR